MHKWLVLLLAGCAVDDLATDTIDSEANVYQWTDDVQIPNQHSNYQVALAPDGNMLLMAYTDASTNELRTTSQPGSETWTPPRNLGRYADYGPALVDYDGALRLVYHARGENRLMMTTYSGNYWFTPVTVGTSIGSALIKYAPSVATDGDNLYLAYCKQDDRRFPYVHIDRYDGTRWTNQAEWALPSECKSVTIARYGTRSFDVLVNTADGHMREASSTGAPTSNTSLITRSMRSFKPSSIVDCADTLHMTHGGFSNDAEIWWTVRESGAWIGDARVPNQASDGGAALGCHPYNPHAVMVHNGGTSQLWWAKYGS